MLASFLLYIGPNLEIEIDSDIVIMEKSEAEQQKRFERC